MHGTPAEDGQRRSTVRGSIPWASDERLFTAGHRLLTASQCGRIHLDQADRAGGQRPGSAASTTTNRRSPRAARYARCTPRMPKSDDVDPIRTGTARAIWAATSTPNPSSLRKISAHARDEHPAR